MTDIIKTRRSVRKFTDKKIPREELCKALDSARFAPSWRNGQPVRYLVIDSGEGLASLSEIYPEGEKNSKTIRDCAALVAVITLAGISGQGFSGEDITGRDTHWQSFDAGIAAQTLCLSLWEGGIASVIIGVFDENRVKEVLKVPAGHSISALVAAGYAQGENPAPPRKSIDEIVSFFR